MKLERWVRTNIASALSHFDEFLMCSHFIVLLREKMENVRFYPEFTYIENDELHKSFALIDMPPHHVNDDSPPTFLVHLCVYSINCNCFMETVEKTEEEEEEEENMDVKEDFYMDVPSVARPQFYPFVMYLLEKGGFPSFSFSLLDYSAMENRRGEENMAETEANADEEKHPQETSFETQCFSQLATLLGGDEKLHNMENIGVLYKGFLQNPHAPEQLYAFLDITSLQYQPMENTKTWVILDEILYKKSIHGNTPIASNVTSLFANHQNISTIRDLEGHPYPIPFQLYLCDPPLKKNVENEDAVFPWDHESFGMAFYFSSDPLQTESVPLRFACFIAQGLYILSSSIEEPPSLVVSLLPEEENLEKEKEDSMEGGDPHPTPLSPKEKRPLEEPPKEETSEEVISKEEEHPQTTSSEEDVLKEKEEDSSLSEASSEAPSEEVSPPPPQNTNSLSPQEEDHSDKDLDENHLSDEEEESEKEEFSIPLMNKEVATEEDILGASTIYFHQTPRLQLWAIKNVSHFTLLS